MRSRPRLLGTLVALLLPGMVRADAAAELLANFPAMPRGSLDVVGQETQIEAAEVLLRYENHLDFDEPYCRGYFTSKLYHKRSNPKPDQYSYGQVLHAPGLLLSNPMSAAAQPEPLIFVPGRPVDAKLARGRLLDHHSFATHGYLLGMDSMTLREVLALSTITTKEEVYQGTPVIQLEAKSKWGVVTFWLDPRQSHLPLRYILRKGQNDLFTAAQTVKGPIDPRRPHAPYSIEFGVEFDTRRIERHGGRHVITSFTQKRYVIDSNDETRGEVQEVTLKNIKPVERWATPPHQFLYTPPNGAKVITGDGQETNYRWEGGALVKPDGPDVPPPPQAAEPSPPDAVPVPHPGGRAWWWWGIPLIAGALYWLWRRVRGRGKPSEAG